MPGLDDRNRREEELAAAILLVFQDYEDDWPNIDWLAFQSDLEAAIGPALTGTYGSAFSQLRDEMELDLGDVDVGQKAADWAAKYSQELASLIVANSQAAALDAEDTGETQFDEARADKIAITETTRSITAGEFGVVGMAVGLGLMSGDEAVWQTAEDELVCDECAPLNEQPQDVWSLVAPAGPPLHVNCRCTLDYRMGMMD